MDGRRLEKIAVPKMAELVAEKIRGQIARGEFKAGDNLPSETELMERFGIARPTMREAIRILESEGLISTRRGSQNGPKVKILDVSVLARRVGLVLQLSGTKFHDLYEAQTAIETNAVRSYCVRGPDDANLRSDTGAACYPTEQDADEKLAEIETTRIDRQFCVVSSAGRELGCFFDREDARARLQETGQERLLQVIGQTARLEFREVLETLTPGVPAYDVTPAICTTPEEAEAPVVEDPRRDDGLREVVGECHAADAGHRPDGWADGAGIDQQRDRADEHRAAEHAGGSAAAAHSSFPSR